MLYCCYWFFWPCLKVFWLSKDNSAGHSARTKKKKVDKRRGGEIISRSGQGCTLPAQLGQLKTELGGKGLLLKYLWCPNDLTRLWDGLD